MEKRNKYIGFGVSLLLFLVVVPYTIVEWLDKSIAFSPVLYAFSGLSIILLAVNTYNLTLKN